MPQLSAILTSCVAALALAFGIRAAFVWRAPTATRHALGWILGLAAGFYAGVWLLDLGPRFSLAEDRDRLLVLILPAAILVELVAILPRLPAKAAWLLRWLLATALGWAMLARTVYLENLPGPDSGSWKPLEAIGWLGILGLAATVVWALLYWLQQRNGDVGVPFSLAMASVGTAVAVMLGGAAFNGQWGFPLAGAFLGAALASICFRASPNESIPIGPGLVCLVALLVDGYFFAELPLGAAIMLLGGPLAAGILELPLARRWGRRSRGAGRLLLVTLTVGLAVYLVARGRILADSATEPGEPTLEDYRDYFR